LPAQVLLAASTEGASRLQMLQVGAQNQNATGRAPYSAPTNSPPPTNGAENCSAAGATADGSPAAGAVDSAVAPSSAPVAGVDAEAVVDDTGADGVDEAGDGPDPPTGAELSPQPLNASAAHDSATSAVAIWRRGTMGGAYRP
jgi:hypothetical protein